MWSGPLALPHSSRLKQKRDVLNLFIQERLDYSPEKVTSFNTFRIIE